VIYVLNTVYFDHLNTSTYKDIQSPIIKTKTYHSINLLDRIRIVAVESLQNIACVTKEINERLM